MPDDTYRTQLFIACTRPAMVWGVPWEGMFVNCGVSYVSFTIVADFNILTMRGIICILMWPVVHYSMRALVGVDHNIFRIMALFMTQRGVQLRGVAVLWAMSWKRPANAKWIASSV